MYAHEHDFDAIIDSASNEYNVPVALIKAIIGQESEFIATAYRAEPQINDASRGLMQLLLGTAQNLGFTGNPDDLYDPTLNIRLGTKYLSDNLNYAASNGYGIDSAISAYNGGFSADRNGDGKRVGDAGTPFINQAYVDSVMSKMAYFAQNAGAPLQPIAITAPATGTAAPAVTVGGVAINKTALYIGVAILFPRALSIHGRLTPSR